MKQTGQTVVLSVVRKKPQALERSLDKVERESSRVSLRRSSDVMARSSGFNFMSPTLEQTYLNTAQLESASDAELRDKWEQALGPKYEVLVVHLDPVIEDDAELQKSSKLLPVHMLRLGVELDSFDGHHYISSLASGGPVDKHGVLRPEDELLEVNDVQLYGKSRREVVSFLKEVPPPFTLVCCRHPTSDLEPDPESESEPEPEPALRLGPVRQAQPSVDEIELKLSSMLCSQTELKESDRDQQVVQQQVEEVLLKEERSPHRQQQEDDEEDEDDGELALWSPDVQVLELQKERDKGLGFSILDYQDPVDAGRCVMVVRSLVPGSPAERHGGLLPGDQLVSVNQTQVDLLTLNEAVEVLKAAPSGTVRLGIRKPLVVDGVDRRTEDCSQESPSNTHLPVPKGFSDSSIMPEDLRQEEEEEEEEEPELILDGGLPRYATSSLTSDLLLPVDDGREMAVDEEEEEEEEKKVEEVKEQQRLEESSGSLPRKPPPSWEEWKLSSSQQVRGAEETRHREEQEELREREEEEEEEEEELQRSDRESIASVGQLILSLPDSRDSEADSELTLTDTDTESIRMTDMKRRRRRGQGGASLPIRGGALPEREEGGGGGDSRLQSLGTPPQGGGVAGWRCGRVEVWQA
ncbi:inaD-like protein [Labrus bergylta]|uniref:inaD-like protein n=1 Tax=Labrus bergylta TaxID=56723 RepID=UPI0033139CE1